MVHLSRPCVRGAYSRSERVTSPAAAGLRSPIMSGTLAAMSSYRSSQQGIGIHRILPTDADQAAQRDDLNFPLLLANQPVGKTMNLCEIFHAAIAVEHVVTDSVAECWESFFSHIKANRQGRPEFDLGALHRAEQLVSEWMQLPGQTCGGAQRNVEIEQELMQIASSFSDAAAVRAGRFWLAEICANAGVYTRQVDNLSSQ